MDSTSRMRRSAAAGAAAAGILLATAACSSGAGVSSRTADAAGSSGLAHQSAGQLSTAARPASGNVAGKAADAVGADVLRRKVIATGSVEVVATSVSRARQAAVDLVTGESGYVSNEQSASDTHGNLTDVHLELRVPQRAFDTTMDALARLGRLEHRAQSAEDVTTQVIDNNARVRAGRASVRSIERLYRRATTIGQVMAIEAQLARRQAALDSLRQQQKWLADQTSMATITMTIRHRHHATTPVTTHAGFLGGLEGGWHALATGGRGLLVAVGAVLPFAGVAAVIGVPVWLLVRRRRPRPVADA